MLKLTRMSLALAATLIALPVLSAGPAGDGFVEEPGDAVSSLEQYRWFRNEEHEKIYAPRIARGAAPAVTIGASGAVNGFEFVGGETGWMPSQHKYVWSAGGFAHSDECDHAIRTVKGPTASEIERVRRFYPGG